MSAFQFKNYEFDYQTLTASFRYVGADGTPFCEVVQFAEPSQPIPRDDRHFFWLLDSALQLAFYLIGTSYYKSRPTKKVQTFGLSQEQADFFSCVYQDGLSQYAFENRLTRANLAHFTSDAENLPQLSSALSYTKIQTLRREDLGGAVFPQLSGFADSALILQSGGKDSLLTAALAKNHQLPAAQFYSFAYIGSSENHPALLDQLDAPLQLIVRRLDHENLAKSRGFNGHVPVTYIVMSLALIQAILNRQKVVLTSIGQEGAEPHAVIHASGTTENYHPDTDQLNSTNSLDGGLDPRDLLVNHQWSKTLEAEDLFRAYIHEFISPELDVYSPLRRYTELKIAELFAKDCWQDYSHKFSSCNVANYGQGVDNHELKWCGKCAKCANSYLLFAPFVPRAELDSLFGNQPLFEKPELLDDFQGLLGINDQLKPFECVGEIAELRYAYHRRLPEYPSLPFDVPQSDFDPERKVCSIQNA